VYAGMLLQEASLDPEFQIAEWMMDRSGRAWQRSFGFDNRHRYNRVNDF
jgi:hypothetical protein